jgi:glycosyltransferase involved in cell wall biosynthesis
MISVVIPLYNKEKSIRATLESVRAQSYADWECIVVEDGSSDNSVSVVESIIAKYKVSNVQCKIQLFSKPNGGVSSARNFGIEKSRGEYIALLDGDDQWDKDYLKEQMKMIHDFPEAAMWGINFAELNHGKLIRKLETDLPDGYRGYVERYFQRPKRISDLFCSSSVVIRREAFDNVGMFDERIKYSEDSDMWFRIISNYPVAFYDRYMVWYLYDAENRAMNRKRLLKYWLPYFVEKYKDPLFKHDKAFYRWIMRWAGVRIKKIYFNDPAQRDDAEVAARKLDYTQLPIKYRFELLTPYWFGKIIYKMLK